MIIQFIYWPITCQTGLKDWTNNDSWKRCTGEHIMVENNTDGAMIRFHAMTRNQESFYYQDADNIVKSATRL